MLHLLQRLATDDVHPHELQMVVIGSIGSVGAGSAWCYKRKRDGTPSRVLKATTTILREGICTEIKEHATPETLLDVLKVYVSHMERVRVRLFNEKKTETDFVDKFYKLQLQNDILQTDTARAASCTSDIAGYTQWVKTVMSSLRRVFNVCATTRLSQQERTRHLRTKGLEEPLEITHTECDWIVKMIRKVSEDTTEDKDIQIAASLCLLQLSTGGRARDIILVNVFTPAERGFVRVGNITKKRQEDGGFEITKPLLTLVFPAIESFMALLCRVRCYLLESASSTLNGCVQWNECREFKYPSLDYDKQWDKDTNVESFVQSWCAKMRRFLRVVMATSSNETIHALLGRGRGTHQLRKLYVACSHNQAGKHMKEPAWTRRVLGHTSYETSLLYMNMIYKQY